MRLLKQFNSPAFNTSAFLLAPLYPITQHNKVHLLSVPTKLAGFLSFHLLNAILENRIASINNFLSQQASEKVAQEGFTVFLSVMLGTPGKPQSKLYVETEFARVCVSKEFNPLARHESSPITAWLRALCRQVFELCGGRGVGAIGMCVTGGFALSLMVDDFVMAPVLSQPSLLFAGPGHKSAFGISDNELNIVKQRAQTGVSLLGLRFTNDKKCPSERFATLRRELGPSGFQSIEIDSSKNNPFHETIKTDVHSALTIELIWKDGHPTKEALDQVLNFFRNRLLS